MAKPAVILVGADKGGVGKTTVARTLLDYFGAHQDPDPGVRHRIAARHAQALPSRCQRSGGRHLGRRSDEDFRHALQREAWVTVIDVRAGLLSSTLQALSDIGFSNSAKKGQITFAVFHISAHRSPRWTKSPKPRASSATPIISW